MYPIARERRVLGCAFGLYDFGFVMGKYKLSSATGVDISASPKIFHAHGGTLNVPSGIAFAPRRLPAHEMSPGAFSQRAKVPGRFVGVFFEARLL